MSDQPNGAPPGQIQMGPVTVVLEPAEASELSMLLGHVLFNMPDHEHLNDQQLATAHYLGGAALKLSAALVQAMKDAGLSDELIARVTGNIQATPVQTGELEVVRNQAAEELAALDPDNGGPVVDASGEEVAGDFVPQDPDFTGADPPNPIPDAPGRATPQEPNPGRGTDPPNVVPRGVPPRPGAKADE